MWCTLKSAPSPCDRADIEFVERNEAAAVQCIAAAKEKDAEVFMGEQAGDGEVFCIHASILHTPLDIRGPTMKIPEDIFRRSKLSSPSDGGADERDFRPDIGANACVKLEVVMQHAQAVLAHLPAGEKLRQFVREVEPELQAL